MSFEEIGFFDPFDSTIFGKTKAEKIVNSLSIFHNVYPKRLMELPEPPMCIFVPEKTWFRKIFMI